MIGARIGYWILRALPFLAFAAPLLLGAGVALARLGGGQSYSGGGGGGGGGNGDWGAIVEIVFWLVIEVPEIGVPVLGIVAVVWVVSKVRAGRRRAVTDDEVTVVASASAMTRRTRLQALLAEDPNFSEPLFLDFVQLVFARAHEARGGESLDHLRAWLAPEAIEALGKMPRVPVRDVIIGASRMLGAQITGGQARVRVDFEANVTEGGAGAGKGAAGKGAAQEAPRQLLVRERWTFVRKADALSPGPDQMQALRCPSCGAASETNTDGTCVRCKTPVSDGRLQWRAERIEILQRKGVTPPKVSWGGGVEVGTELPTVRDPDFGKGMRALTMRDPGFALKPFVAWVEDVFLKLQRAWSEQRWEEARPFETDHLFQTHRFWIERYRATGWTNHLDDVEVLRVVPVKVTTDAWYESIVVRVFAKMRDWTSDAEGTMVGGDPNRARTFSEYWTFVRAVGSRTEGEPSTENCPSCGAALDRVDIGGVCGYCETKIAGGAHGWVLSAIAQDESYEG